MTEESRDLSIEETLDLGWRYGHQGDHRSAIALYRGVLMHDPANLTAILRLGACLFEEKQLFEALYWFWRARKLDRRHPMVLTNYGLTLSMLGHWEEGLADIERAVHQAQKVKLDPDHMALVYNNLGNTLERLRRYPEALAALDKGLVHCETDAFPHYNRGIVLLRLNRPEEAIAAFDRSLELDPGNADAIYNRGMGRLLLGDLKGGFEDYEYRLITSENEAVLAHLGVPGVKNLGLPPEKKWPLGTSIEGKALLVHGEQGIGDTLQFLRYLPQLMARCAQVKLIVHSAIRPLLGDVVETLPTGKDIDHSAYDHWVGIMSLPLYLGLESEDDIPPPWLPPVERDWLPLYIGLTPDWERKFTSPGDKPRIGVCWAGNWRHKNNVHRSIPLDKFATLFEARNCNFISLQQMQQIDTDIFPRITEKYANVTALWLDDLHDTAAVMRNLDLVVTVDTAVAHLAGTLGAPTWILVPATNTDWRWQRKRSDSPWYPSVKLYRQDQIGNWHGTLTTVRRDLEGLAVSAQRAA